MGFNADTYPPTYQAHTCGLGGSERWFLKKGHVDGPMNRSLSRRNIESDIKLGGMASKEIASQFYVTRSVVAAAVGALKGAVVKTGRR